MRPHSARTAASALLLVFLVALTACGTDTPAPTRTSSAAPSATATQSTSSPNPTEPSPEEVAEATKQAIIEEGKASLITYTEKANSIHQNGMQGWQELLSSYSTEELLDKMENFYIQMSEQGIRQIGAPAISSMTVTAFTEDPTGASHERMTVDVCIDTTGSDFVNPAGESVTLEGYPKRLVTVYELQRQEVGHWTLNSANTDESRPC